MRPLDLRAALRDLPELRIAAGMREEDAAASMRMLGPFNRCAIGLVRFSGETPWERHPEDELIHVLEGEVTLTLLPVAGPPERISLGAGEVCVVPRALWHRQHASATAALLFATSEEGNETSSAEDPRRA